MNLRLIIITVTAAIASLNTSAQTVGTQPAIVANITADGINTIKQPAELAKLLLRSTTALKQNDDTDNSNTEDVSGQQSPVVHERIAGFRVQIISDNSPKAKAEARTKKRAISERFPELASYVTYTSPYWRLRVGDFRTRREAEEAAEEIRQAFPAYSKEIRVVNDRIKLPSIL